MTPKPDFKWVIVGKDSCRWCHQVMMLLQSNSIDYTYLNMDRRPDLKTFILDCGLKTAPQVYVNGDRIGGFDETEAYLKANWPSVRDL